MILLIQLKLGQICSIKKHLNSVYATTRPCSIMNHIPKMDKTPKMDENSKTGPNYKSGSNSINGALHNESNFHS